MRTLLLLALTFAAAAAPAAAAAEERVVPITDFDRIVVEGAFDVTLVRDRATRAVVSGPRASVEAVRLETVGRTLRIRRNASNWGGYPGQQPELPRIRVATNELRFARLVGAGSLGIESARAQRLELILEGSGRIRAVDLAVDHLSVGVRGSGGVSLAGQAERFSADVQGAAELDAEALDVADLTLTTVTSGSVAARARRTAGVTAGGLGTVAVLGSPACTVRGPNAAAVTCGTRR